MKKIPIQFYCEDTEYPVLVIDYPFSKYYTVLKIDKIKQSIKTLTLFNNTLLYCYEECDDRIYFVSKRDDYIGIIGYYYLYLINHEVLKL